MLKDCYEGKVVHVIGGVSEYIGSFGEHPLASKNGMWIRLNKPCVVQMDVNDAGSIKIRLMRIGGVQGNYEDRIDMHFPKDTFLEIRELGKRGTLYKAYKEELDRQVLDKIIDPNSVDISKLTKIHAV